MNDGGSSRGFFTEVIHEGSPRWFPRGFSTMVPQGFFPAVLQRVFTAGLHDGSSRRFSTVVPTVVPTGVFTTILTAVLHTGFFSRRFDGSGG
jgi:hypothetical protein